MLLTARKLDVRFSITVRQDPKIKAAIAAIPDDAWTPIPYWRSTPDVSGADVAETTCTCFAHTKTPVAVRLIVRRVRPAPGSQPALLMAVSPGCRPRGRRFPALLVLLLPSCVPTCCHSGVTARNCPAPSRSVQAMPTSRLNRFTQIDTKRVDS
ncbi:hypothetical protein [Streptomyces sp. NPDC006739]|uniref:hypothetical protein n=1 Tax=Streptomyces sp. NPDC006739 TaxID=3364763 RepID=UPI0036AD9EA0